MFPVENVSVFSSGELVNILFFIFFIFIFYFLYFSSGELVDILFDGGF